MGKILFPLEYPFKPPDVMVITESGRFITNMGICLAISSHHPESWNPSYGVRNIILGLITFWLCNEWTYGCPNTPSNEERVKIAQESREKVLDMQLFKDLFVPFKDFIGLGELPKPAPELLNIKEEEEKQPTEVVEEIKLEE